jgi:hypothetical protein
MRKILLTGVLAIGILATPSCFAKRRKPTATATSSETVEVISIPDSLKKTPPPVLDAFNKALVGTWIVIPSARNDYPFERMKNYFDTVAQLEFTEMKECVVYKSGSRKAIYFNATKQSITFDPGGCLGSFPQEYMLKGNRLGFIERNSANEELFTIWFGKN